MRDTLSSIILKMHRHIARFRVGGGTGGGGSGGGGGGTQTIQKADPWEGQQQYLKSLYSSAQGRFNSSAPQYYPDNTILGFDPLEQASQQAATNYVNSPGVAGTNFNAQNALNQMLSGASRGIDRSNMFTNMQIAPEQLASPSLQNMLSGDAAQNPYLQPALDAATSQAMRQFNQQIMPSVRANQIAYQPGGSSRGDIATGLAAGNLAERMGELTSQGYLQAQNQALADRQFGIGMLEQGRAARAGEGLGQAGMFGAAAGAYPQFMSTPLDLMGAQNQIGFARRELGQQNLDEDINRWNFGQNIYDQKLREYANIVQGMNPGGTVIQSQTRGGTGLGGAIGQGLGYASILGGLLQPKV